MTNTFAELVDLLGQVLAENSTLALGSYDVDTIGTRAYYKLPDSGVIVITENDLVISVHFLIDTPATRESGYASFSGELPCNITKHDCREDVRKKLGIDPLETEIMKDCDGIFSNVWDSYMIFSKLIIFSFNSANERLVAISAQQG